MGIGNSTLGGSSSKAWWDAWPQHTSGSEQQRARLVDGFEGVEPEPEEPVPPVTVAQVHAFEQERERQRRAPDPAGLPVPWTATAFLLWADISRTALHVRQASTLTRQIRSAPDDTGHDAGVRPYPASLQPNDASSRSLNGTAPVIPAAGEPAEIRPHQYLVRQLDQLEPSLLSGYLRAAGYAEAGERAGCAPAWQELSALYDHLAPARFAGGDPADPGRFNARALQQLMRYAMQELGFYGDRDGQAVAPAFQRQVLIKLISRWANGCTQTPARIAGYSWSEAAWQRRAVTQIKQEVERRLQAFGLQQEVAAWAGAMLLAGAEPALAHADTPGDLRYGSLEWADLQTGIDTASALGLDHWSMTYTELVALAQASDMTARLDPDAAAGLLALQVRTALVFAGISPEQEDLHAGERTLQALTALAAARTARWEALRQRQHTLAALHAPIPTRSQLAEQILSDHGIHPDQTFSTPPLSGTPAVGGHVEPITDTALNLYLDGAHALAGRNLPNDLELRFEQAFTQYKTNIQQAIALLYGEAIATLPAEDRTFWQNGNAQILVPECKINLFPSNYRATYQARPQTAIAAITHDGKIRHYLVTLSDSDRPVRFIALDPKDPGKTLTRDGKKLFTAEQWRYIKLASNVVGRRPNWVLPVWGSGPAISMLAQYFTEPIEKLREQAYAPTANQQALRRIRDGMLSLIPLYHCVSEVQAGNAGSAVLSCAVDVVSLIPVVGTALRAGVGVGRLTVQVSSSVLRQLAQTSAKGLLSQQTLRTVMAETARTVPLATSLARSSGNALAWDAAYLLDPGFQLLRGVGKGMLRGSRALIENLRQSRGLQALADRIGAALKRQPFHFDAQAGVWQTHRRAIAHRDGRQFTQIGGREVEVIDMGTTKYVPVVRLDDSADDVRFALVDPRSGLPYGAQWIRTSNGFEALSDYRVRLKGRVPSANARGIVEFRQRQYIQVENRYYPVRHSDENGPTWRIYKEHNPSGYAAPVRYDARQRTWTVHADVGGRGGHSLLDIDIEQIRNLPEQQRLTAFKGVARAAGALSEAKRAGVFALLGNRISRLPESDRWEAFALVAAAATTLRQPHNTLLALATHIESVALPRQSEAFELVAQCISGAADRLTGMQHGGLLNTLARRIGALPEADRWTAFALVAERASHAADVFIDLIKTLTHASSLLGDRQWMALKRICKLVEDVAGALDGTEFSELRVLLAHQIGDLPNAHRWDAFGHIAGLRHASDDAARHPCDVLLALGKQIESIPTGSRWEAFKRIYKLVEDTAGSLTGTELAGLIKTLIHASERLEGRQWAAFRLVYKLTKVTADASTGTELTGLIRTLIYASEGLGDRQWSGFRRICKLVETRADSLTGAGLAELIGALVFRINRLGNKQPDAFELVVDLVNDTVGSLTGTELTGLIKALIYRGDLLSGAERWQIVRHIDQLIDDAAGPVLSAAELTELRVLRAHQIKKLEEEYRWQAFQQIAGPRLGRGGIPYQHPHDVLLALEMQIAFLPPGARWEAFQSIADRLSDATPTLTRGQRAVQLRRLAHNIRVLPEEHRWNGFQRVAAATSALRQDGHGVVLMLAKRIESLPSAWQWKAFQSVAGAADAFAGEQLADLLKALTHRISFLPSPADRWDAFRRIVGAAGKLAGEQRVHVFIGLRRRISSLDTVEQQQAAYDLIEPILNSGLAAA